MKKILIFILKIYKYGISPIFVNMFGKACRFTPSCSTYTIEALEKYGALKGLGLGIKRLGKCHPWGSMGFDPVN
jgi:uncharacterized protein